MHMSLSSPANFLLPLQPLLRDGPPLTGPAPVAIVSSTVRLAAAAAALNSRARATRPATSLGRPPRSEAAGYSQSMSTLQKEGAHHAAAHGSECRSAPLCPQQLRPLASYLLTRQSPTVV